MKFTELGALRFDRDLRNITQHLSNQTQYGVAALRDSFSRLQQIAMLLSVESVSSTFQKDAPPPVQYVEIRRPDAYYGTCSPCTQVSDADDLANGVGWKLSQQDVNNFLALRVSAA